ncbi:LacI family DNA-binding transcriptional regulator [Curtobacterium sp. 9128]|uniref:LacI family DNA-binding transcriptional regulator n=1 Tax=Curtobacterium sp. 9128 TaxID=1793722 RepID=UPI00119CFE64|nr:LacI family DNA-binding transcriptional regulator [Curtobacterium sp. 9128]
MRDRRTVHRVTLKDVAVAAGVSQSTTSRALSGEGYVAAGVRERVAAVAEELGYVPHAMARSLRTQSSRVIGVLVSDLQNSFYADLAAGISARARELGYTMMLVDDRGDGDEELAAAHAFVATRVAGVVLTPLSGTATSWLVGQRIPVVEADRRFCPDLCDAVIIDNAAAAQRITDHLIAIGHRRIALVLDESEWTTGAQRAEGYAAALEAAGIETDPGLRIVGGWDVDQARGAAVNALAGRDRPTAVFAVNNVLAEGVWRAAGDLGLRMPEDLSMVSFDDAQWMSMVTPGVTAIAQDAVALGRTAVDRLVSRLEDPEAPVTTDVLAAQIRPRGSTGAPPTD